MPRSTCSAGPTARTRDFPLATAAERILFVKCLNAGQVCTSVDHVWLQQARLDEFVSLARTIVPAYYPSPRSTRRASAVPRWCRCFPARPSIEPRARSRRTW